MAEPVVSTADCKANLYRCNCGNSTAIEPNKHNPRCPYVLWHFDKGMDNITKVIKGEW